MFTQSFIQTQIKGNIKAPRHWPLCGEFTGTGEFPAQRASYAKNVSIWWRHHESKSLFNTQIAFYTYYAYKSVTSYLHQLYLQSSVVKLFTNLIEYPLL